MTETTSAEKPQDTFLDACAMVMALQRGDVASAEILAQSYVRTGEVLDLLRAVTALAQTAVYYAGVTAGIDPDKLLAGAVAEIRSHAR